MDILSERFVILEQWRKRNFIYCRKDTVRGLPMLHCEQLGISQSYLKFVMDDHCVGGPEDMGRRINTHKCLIGSNSVRALRELILSIGQFVSDESKSLYLSYLYEDHKRVFLLNLMIFLGDVRLTSHENMLRNCLGTEVQRHSVLDLG